MIHYFGLSCVRVILLVELLLVITMVNGRIERRKQAQADGISSIIAFKEN
jgi:hypothetical protein